MASNRQKQIDDIVVSLSRVREQTPAEYEERVKLYRDMREGGDGGLFRNSRKKIRELHFSGWDNRDFHILLEKLGEVEELSPEELDEKFPRKSFFKRLFG